jgi:hypothetical protein
MEVSPLTVGMIVVVGLLVIFRLSLSTKGAKKARRRGPGAGAAGAFYEMLNEDKRKAIEIVVEQKAAARDEETADDTVDPPGPPRA